VRLRDHGVAERSDPADLDADGVAWLEVHARPVPGDATGGASRDDVTDLESESWEEAAVAQMTGSRIAPCASLGLAVFQGNAKDALPMIESGTTDVLRRGEGAGLSFIQWAAALLHNSLGRYQEALNWARQASDDSSARRFAGWALPELIEAAARVGDRDQGVEALRRVFRKLGVTSRTQLARPIQPDSG
jgi:hypothetical protein